MILYIKVFRTVSETVHFSKYYLKKVVLEQNLDGWGAGQILKGLLKRDGFPVKGTSDLLWSSLSVLPQEISSWVSINIFCDLEFNQLELTSCIVWRMHLALFLALLLVLILPDLSSTQQCWPWPSFQNTGFLAWLFLGFLQSPVCSNFGSFAQFVLFWVKFNPYLSILLILSSLPRKFHTYSCKALATTYTSHDSQICSYSPNFSTELRIWITKCVPDSLHSTSQRHLIFKS